MGTLEVSVLVFEWIWFLTKLNIPEATLGNNIRALIYKLESIAEWWLVPSILKSLDLE